MTNQELLGHYREIFQERFPGVLVEVDPNVGGQSGEIFAVFGLPDGFGLDWAEFVTGDLMEILRKRGLHRVCVIPYDMTVTRAYYPDQFARWIEKARANVVHDFYLAARYGRREEILDYARRLEKIGHSITSRWLQGGHEMPELGDNDSTDEAFNRITDDERRRIGCAFAEDDFNDLLRANWLVSFTESPGKAKGRSRGGRHVELGIALAMQKVRSQGHAMAFMDRITIIGPRENVFCCLPCVEHFDNFDMFISSLSKEACT